MEKLNIIFAGYCIKQPTTIGILTFEPLQIGEKIVSYSYKHYNSMAEKSHIIAEIKKIWAIISFDDSMKNREYVPIAPLYWNEKEPNIIVPDATSPLMDCHNGIDTSKYNKTAPIMIWFCLYLAETNAQKKLNNLYQCFSTLYQIQNRKINQSSHPVLDALIEHIEQSRVVVEEEYEDICTPIIHELSTIQVLELEELLIDSLGWVNNEDRAIARNDGIEA